MALEALRSMEAGVREAAKAGVAMVSEKDKAAGELKEVRDKMEEAVAGKEAELSELHLQISKLQGGVRKLEERVRDAESDRVGLQVYPQDPP